MPAPYLVSNKMKHTDWLRLQAEGEKLCATLQQYHYHCLKQPHRLAWKIHKHNYSYLLAWIPAPLNDWVLTPNDTTRTYQSLWSLIQTSLNTLRKTELTHQSIPQPQELIRPWAIVRLLPNAQHYTVARFYNRQDAQDYLRFLNRLIPAAEFELLFDNTRG